mgnify:CR=1 FL=1
MPALAGELIPLPVPVPDTDACSSFATRSPAAGPGDAATHIRESMDSGRLEAASLLTASLHRDQAALRTGAVAPRACRPILMWLRGRARRQPVRARAAADAVRQRSRPAICAMRSTRGTTATVRRAVRGRPSAKWQPVTARFAARSVPAPGSCRRTRASTARTAATPSSRAAPDAERKDRRIEVCSTCGGYLKTHRRPRACRRFRCCQSRTSRRRTSTSRRWSTATRGRR